MRPIAALFAALLFAGLSTLAHADTIYTYTGTVLLNGSFQTYTDDQPGTVLNYVNLPLNATVLIRQFVDANGAPDENLNLYSVLIDFPAGQFDSDDNEEYVNFENCFMFPGNCTDVFLSNYYDLLPVTPAPSLNLSGVRSYFNLEYGTETYIGWNESFSGDLNLVTAATPEPSTFALLGTGLIGLAATLKRRVTS